jgi:plastocyanin domain-containing protein
VTRSAEAEQEEVRKKVLNDFSDPVTRRKGVQEVALIAGDLGFFPKTIFVSRDVPVRLFVTGTAKGSLCLMMDSFNVRKQVRTSKIEEITFTPTQAGTYRFYCPVNGSEGTMVVKELTTEADALE